MRNQTTRINDAVEEIRASLAGLVPSERRVAQATIADPRGAIRKSAAKLAAEAETSATTVIRLARSLGYSGYQELTLALAANPVTRDTEPERVAPGDSAAQILQKVATRAADTLTTLPRAIDEVALEDAIAALAAARSVLCLGASLTAPVALDLAIRLNHIGINAHAPTDSQAQRFLARALGPDDVCVAVLYGGAYPRVVDAATDARAAGAAVIAVTAFGDTPLAHVGSHCLITGADALESGITAWPARTAFIAMVDTLLSGLLAADPGRFAPIILANEDLVEVDLP